MKTIYEFSNGEFFTTAQLIDGALDHKENGEVLVDGEKVGSVMSREVRKNNVGVELEIFNLSRF